MPTKEELSDRVNEILGLGDPIDFSKMTKEDLESFLKTIKEPSNLIRIGWKNLKEKAKKEILEELIERPLVDVLKGLGKEEKEGKDKGPLGLGILPRAMTRIRGVLEEKGEAE